jgi:hypothetical protein
VLNIASLLGGEGERTATNDNDDSNNDNNRSAAYTNGGSDIEAKTRAVMAADERSTM